MKTFMATIVDPIIIETGTLQNHLRNMCENISSHKTYKQKLLKELLRSKDKLFKVVRMIGLPVEKIYIKISRIYAKRNPPLSIDNLMTKEIPKLVIDPYDLLVAIVYDKFKDKLNEFNITSKENVLKMKKLVDDLVWIYDNYVKEVYDEYYYMFFYNWKEVISPLYCYNIWINLAYLRVLINVLYFDKMKELKGNILKMCKSERDALLKFIKGFIELEEIGVKIFCLLNEKIGDHGFYFIKISINCLKKTVNKNICK